MPLLVDTGVLYALADADDDWHAASRQLLESRRELLLAPAPVLPEVACLLRSRLGARAELQFVESLAAGEVGVEDLLPRDYQRVVELLRDYPDVGFVDACVATVAERLGLDVIATTDRRHFAQLRPRHTESFHLVP